MSDPQLLDAVDDTPAPGVTREYSPSSHLELAVETAGSNDERDCNEQGPFGRLMQKSNPLDSDVHESDVLQIE